VKEVIWAAEDLKLEEPEIIEEPTATRVDNRINTALPELIADLVSTDSRPLTGNEFKRRYVGVVAPILNFIGFHEVFGSPASMPKWARGLIGFACMGGVYLIMRRSALAAMRERLKKVKSKKFPSRQPPKGPTPPSQGSADQLP